MTTLNDLISQKAKLEKEIQTLQAEQKGSAIAKIKSLMAAYDLRAEDIQPASRPRLGGKIAAKYRDLSGKEWSGRGIKPRWLQAAIANGQKLEDFAI